MISDTGYRGTWTRGKRSRTSRSSRSPRAPGWRYFRWSQAVVGREDHVIALRLGRFPPRVARWASSPRRTTVTTRFDPASGLLSTDTIEDRHRSDRRNAPLLGRDGGQGRRAHAVELHDRSRRPALRGGRALPMRSFTKIANSVANPSWLDRPPMKHATESMESLGYRFQDRAILERALTHRSRAHEVGERRRGNSYGAARVPWGMRCSGSSCPSA